MEALKVFIRGTEGKYGAAKGIIRDVLSRSVGEASSRSGGGGGGGVHTRACPRWTIVNGR